MEGMDSVRHIICPGDWMVKLDLKDAYLSVPVCLEHQPFLCFRLRDICYLFTCLAFGLSPAPPLFTKLLKPVAVALRRAGIRLVIYLDDIIFMNESREGVISDVSTAIDLPSSLGFLVNWDKSVLLPSQTLEYLCLLIDSIAFYLALSSSVIFLTNCLCFLKREPDLVIFSDASLHGWGFTCDGVYSRGPWAA